MPTSWSADGKTLMVATSGISDLVTLSSSQKDQEPVPYLKTANSETGGQFSNHSGFRWVLYSSDETGQYEIYLRTYPEATGKRQISIGGGRRPKWGPAGREVFYVNGQGALTVVSVRLNRDTAETGTPRELFDLGGDQYDFDPNGERILVGMYPKDGGRKPLKAIVNWKSLFAPR